MAKQIAKLLKASIQDTSDLKQIAKQLAGKGRGGDTMLVHITPKEAKMLKASGGAGTINPDTGLLEFYDGDFRLSDYADFSSPDISSGGYRTRADRTSTVPTPDITESYTPAGQSYNLMQFGAAPNVQTGGYEQPAYTPAGAPSIDLTQMGGAYDPRTGGMTGYGTPYTFEGRPSVFPISAEAATPSPVIAPSVPPVRSVDEGLLGRVGKFLTREGAGGVTPLERLGVAGLSALPGVLQARQAAQQGQRYREDLQRLAAPYQEQGKRLVEQAQRGELTAPNQQQIQAMQARMAQGVATRGGVGAEQAQVQLEAFRQQLLANQFDLGLKVSGIGDQIATGAIKSGLQADQYVSELTNSYFNNAFRMAMGGGAAAPTPVR
jgi:hypothetical protein